MKTLRFLFIMMIIACSVMAQNTDRSDTDEQSLIKRLSLSKEGVERIRLCLALGRAILYRAGGSKGPIDSAINLAETAEVESRKIKFNEGIINALVIRALCDYKKEDNEQGLKFANQALGYATNVADNNGIAESYIAIGKYYPYSQPQGLRTRTDYYHKATELFRKEHNMGRLADILEDDADLYFLANKKTEAIKLLFEALNVKKAIRNKNVQGIYWMIARTSNGLNDYPDAIKYNLLAIRSANETGDSTLKLCSIYHNMAATYMGMGNFREALPYSLKALSIARRFKDRNYIITTAFAAAGAYTHINRFNEALPLLKEMERNDPDHSNEMVITACYLTNLTYIRQFDKAEAYARKLRSILNKYSPDDFNALTVPYSFLANYYTDSHQLELAYHYAYLHGAIPAAARTAVTVRSVENVLYRLDSTRGDLHSAIKHYQLAQRIKDSVDNVAKSYQISLLQIENDTENKEQEIEALNKSALIRDNDLKRNELIQKVIMAGCLMLAIITALIYSRYRLKQKSNALLLKQKSEIDQQNVELQLLVNDKNQLIGDKDLLLHEKDGLLMDKDILLKDKDLLIKEVNHRVKNNLQIVMSLLQSQSGYLQDKQAQNAILEGQNRVQSIALIHEQLFRSDHATQVDLVTYIGELVRCLNYSINKGSDQVKISFDIDPIMLDVSQAIPVGIILNEAVTNALKYAFPSDRTGEIRLVVKEVRQMVTIQIDDNGAGLPEDFTLENANSLGMTLIRGLAGQLDGTFDIINDHGVRIVIDFPMVITEAPLAIA